MQVTFGVEEKKGQNRGSAEGNLGYHVKETLVRENFGLQDEPDT